MEYGAYGLADQVRDELEDSYHKHGCGAEFWNTYQRVLARLVPEGQERAQVANDMAMMIQSLGIVRQAQLVPADTATDR
ncbi:hypothetical protein [Xanthomonas sp. 60]